MEEMKRKQIDSNNVKMKNQVCKSNPITVIDRAHCTDRVVAVYVSANDKNQWNYIAGVCDYYYLCFFNTDFI